MAFSNLNGPDNDEGQMADINVTPFVDVVLVLLIIFMITAGVVEFGLSIEVPQTRQVASSSQDLQFINITQGGELFLGSDPINLYDITDSIISAGHGEKGVYIRAHKEVPWEILAQVVAECGSAGIPVSLVTKPMERNPR